jgi:hypothetical protein
MAFKEDLITARSYIVFIAGLLTAFVMVYYIEKNAAIKTQIPPVAMIKSVIPSERTPQATVALQDNTVAVPVVETTTPEQATTKVTTAIATTTIAPKINPSPVASEMMADVAIQKPVVLAAIDAKTPSLSKYVKRPLTAEEQVWAKTAWQYFVNNTQETGLVNSVHGYAATTMWDTASYMMAAISAQRLGIISNTEFDTRMSSLLSSLANMPLFDNKLPNKSYNTKTLAMVNYANKETAQGIGWSAIDIGRILVPLKILQSKYPQHKALVKQVLGRWSMTDVVHHGLMFGAVLDKKNEVRSLQEGRLGYEQYAAKTFNLFGYAAENAANYTTYLTYVDIYGIDVGVDKRDPKTNGAQNYVLSEPYILDGLEFGFDKSSKELSSRLYLAQQARFKKTGILTAVSEDHIDVAPYFVYNTVYVAGKTWAAITDKGQDASAFKSLSTKTVFGWHALYNTDYSALMLKAVNTLNEPTKGWYAGLYEQTGKPNKAITANTNGVVLQSLAYIKYGKSLP